MTAAVALIYCYSCFIVHGSMNRIFSSFNVFVHILALNLLKLASFCFLIQHHTHISAPCKRDFSLLLCVYYEWSSIYSFHFANCQIYFCFSPGTLQNCWACWELCPREAVLMFSSPSPERKALWVQIHFGNLSSGKNCTIGNWFISIVWILIDNN